MKTTRREAHSKVARAKPAKRDWLHAGLLRFAEGGERSLQVERIADDLGVTKGSYYYHFGSRDHFIEQMLAYAMEVTTQVFIDRASEESSPVERLRRLTVSVLSERRGKDFDFHLRDFARRNRSAAQFVRDIDGQRIAYIRELLSGCGLDDSQAALKAEVYYCCYLGWYARNKDRRLTRSDLTKQLRLFSEIAGIDLATP